jgi:hypothetical protein
VCCKAAHFLRHQLAVWAPALHEAIRRTVFDDLARFQHHHPVEIAQRGQAMRDGDHRASTHQAAKRIAVERSGGFIEQQDWRILKNARAMAMRYYRPRCLMQKSALHSRGLLQLYRSIAVLPPSNTIELPIDAAPHRVEGMACRRSVCWLPNVLKMLGRRAMLLPVQYAWFEPVLVATIVVFIIDLVGNSIGFGTASSAPQ